MDAGSWLGVAGVAVGVAGIVAAYGLYIKGRQQPAMTWAVRKTRIVDPGDRDDIEVRHQGEPVPRVSQAAVTIWNSGTGTLEPDHVPALDPIVIRIAEGRVLTVVAEGPSPANGVRCETTDDVSVRLVFDYLDPRDEAIVTIAHTGPRGVDVDVSGTIKGAGAVRHFDYRSWAWQDALGLLLLPVLVVIVLVPLEAMDRGYSTWVVGALIALGGGVYVVGFRLLNRFEARRRRLVGGYLDSV